MPYRSMFPRDLLTELERLQRQRGQLGDRVPSIRGTGRDGFPPLNIGHTAQSIEIFVFVPGMAATDIDLLVEKGVLTLSGERPSLLPPAEAQATAHMDERFAGRFRRVVNLPEDCDVAAIQARYRDGVLQISIPRRSMSQPRRIDIQHGDTI